MDKWNSMLQIVELMESWYTEFEISIPLSLSYLVKDTNSPDL